MAQQSSSPASRLWVAAPRSARLARQQYFAPNDLAIIVVGDRKQIDEELAALRIEAECLRGEELWRRQFVRR